MKLLLAIALVGCSLVPVAWSQEDGVVSAGRINGTRGFGFWPNGTAITDWARHSTQNPPAVTPNVPLVTPRPPDASDLWTQPPSAPGQSPNVDYWPYDETWDIPYQNLSMISFYQLRLFMNNYNQMMSNVASATGVSLASAPKAWYKQVAYTYGIWFPETLAYWGITDVEAIWTDRNLDAHIQNVATRYHTQIVGLYSNDSVTVITYSDLTGYLNHKWNLRYPRNKMVLASTVNLGYAMMEASRFYLGPLGPEVGSAFQNVFLFLNALNWHHLDMYDTDCIRRTMPSMIIVPDGALNEIYPDINTLTY